MKKALQFILNNGNFKLPRATEFIDYAFSLVYLHCVVQAGDFQPWRRLVNAPELKKAQHEIASWESVITRYQKTYEFMRCASLRRGDRDLSLRVKITPGEWSLRLTRPNWKCYQNFVCNIEIS